MNFICATVELTQLIEQPVEAYGLTYLGAEAVIPHDKEDSRIKLRILTVDYNGNDKIKPMMDWKPGQRVLITGQILFDQKQKGEQLKPIDVQLVTFEPNIANDTYINQVTLGSAYFTDGEIQVKDSGLIRTSIGITMDYSDARTWLQLEVPPVLKDRLEKRAGKATPVQPLGYLREYHTDSYTYRALVAQAFTNPKPREKASSAGAKTGSAAGYAQAATADPAPDF